MSRDHGHERGDAPRRIAAGEFKARCLKLMDEVAASGRSLVITKRGKPVARLMPADGDGRDEAPPLFGYLKGSVTVHGDIVGPLHEEWAARDADESDRT